MHLLALAMPFMTLQVLLQPACDARGRPGIGVRNGAFGAGMLAIGFILGVRYGPTGLAAAWICAYPIYLGFSLWRSLPVIGASFQAVALAIVPALVAAAVMAVGVAAVDRLIPASITPLPRLLVLTASGAALYAGWLGLFARTVLREVFTTISKRPTDSMNAKA
ncbi:hypothetical protein ABIC16_000164 [Sphingomonas sp. PvP055]